MKIFGDEASCSLTNYVQEPGRLWGDNDVLKGEIFHHTIITYSRLFGTTREFYAVEPKLYLHIFRNAWSSFTGKLREYCLPWRWHSVYLDKEDGTPPERILVCVNLYDRYSNKSPYSTRLLELLNRSFFVANLIKEGLYCKLFLPSTEYLALPDGQTFDRIVTHPLLGEFGGSQIAINSPDYLCHIYRIRGIFSFLKYHFLKCFSREWEEVAIRAGEVSEQILIKTSDRAIFSNTGLI